MPAKRRPTPNEITEAFSDFPTSTQELVLDSLTQIHRILKRERSRTAPLSSPELLGQITTEIQQRHAAQATEYQDHEN